mmetsp:Transcript_6253/g.10316  ORF Transcript_6253/g.10316 Transcript_6253/m.10316 type:complete len:209 (+) Transcript_6253:25-651(+)
MGAGCTTGAEAACPTLEDDEKKAWDDLEVLSNRFSRAATALRQRTAPPPPRGVVSPEQTAFNNAKTELLNFKRANAAVLNRVLKKWGRKNDIMGKPFKAHNGYLNFYEKFDDDSQRQNAYLPAFSYGGMPSYSYQAPQELAYQTGVASDSSDYAMMMALTLGVFVMICVLCFVLNMVMAAGGFIFGQRQSSMLRQTKYRSNMVDHAEV